MRINRGGNGGGECVWNVSRNQAAGGGWCVASTLGLSSWMVNRVAGFVSVGNNVHEEEAGRWRGVLDLYRSRKSEPYIDFKD